MIAERFNNNRRDHEQLQCKQGKCKQVHAFWTGFSAGAFRVKLADLSLDTNAKERHLPTQHSDHLHARATFSGSRSGVIISFRPGKNMTILHGSRAILTDGSAPYFRKI